LILTGRFESKALQTNGRASIYKEPGGREYLHLNDFGTGSVPDVHILLARSDEPKMTRGGLQGDVDHIDLGPLKDDQSDQRYDLPAAIDLGKYHVAVIYSEQSHAVVGSAQLEAF
jgi:hypothetical protein